MLTALPHVDEIVLGVDGRSDAETLEVAQAYADTCSRVRGADIGLDAEAWAAKRIHFANARNLGRMKRPGAVDARDRCGRVHRELSVICAPIREVPRRRAHECDGQLGRRDSERLTGSGSARTSLRWTCQLAQPAHVADRRFGRVELSVMEDKTLRRAKRTHGVNKQRMPGSKS